MHLKVALLIFAIISLEVMVDAELFFNRLHWKAQELDKLGLKCIPGHTVIRIRETVMKPDDSSEEITRRSHMNAEPKDETCQICVCSVEGKDEYCSRRPARNVNECIRMGILKKNMERNLPFDHERSLAFRIRRVGDEANDASCVPFVSEYSDCTDANSCSGCNRCVCTAEGEWRCETVFDCAIDDGITPADRETVSTALDILYSELKNKAKKKSRDLVPSPPKPDDELIVPDVNYYEEDFSTYLSRQKRSIQDEDNNKNRTINFIHTTDDINEDTLKDTNKSGTIVAQQVDMKLLPKISRRTDLLDNLNKTVSNPLHIEYNSQEYDHHITENKIEPVSEPKNLDILSKSKLYKVIGNYSQSVKNKDLSALVVNELKRGTEIIGDKNVSPMSNITFTPENDTLTAMTFIAGNLLNKLWDMEKESSDETIETLKHKKINDLLELFKEPLSIRQETFLKNALLKLSDTLNKNKNAKNVSLCETITDSDILTDDNLNKNDFRTDKRNKTKCVKSKLEIKQEVKDNPKEISADVIYKLNNVLSLMHQFEQVQKSLSELKHPTKDTQSHKPNVHENLTTDKNSPINLFGNLLERITELLLPSNASKKFTNRLKTLNQFNNNGNAKKVIGDKLKIDLNKNNMTVKDKIIFDYLNHIENNPNCLLRKYDKKTDESKINVEGDILYNLSEFFKIKSLIDLVKLTKSDKTSTVESITTTDKYKKITTPASVLRDTAVEITSNESKKLNVTKEKLKNHLKALIDDILELQNEKDPKSKNNINILDALPCIYNILNADRQNNDQKQTKQDTEPLEKIKILIDSLKLEFTSNVPTRRNNLITTERPRSARIWERILKNVNNQRKETRRNLNTKRFQSYEELKTIMEALETSSNSYKKFALLSVITPQKRLMLLKTLEADTKQKILALEKIKDSIDTLNKLPADKRKEFKEFIDNIENNINLSVKVLQNLAKTKQVNSEKSTVEVFDPKKFEATNAEKAKQETLNIPQVTADIAANYKSNDVKLTRDQIVGRLIENRIKFYLESKEKTEIDLSGDISYNIGKRILSLLRQGNFNVAKELFKVFIASNPREMEKKNDSASMSANIKQKRPLLLELKEPLIRLDESSKKSPEQLFRQLLNLKKINIK
ncbi:unnamed protein product [Euphydryas editha]|uniref:Uncharacterized protein n=1 Tax=Euphydryas editha TaxID=104508 RepID=A0AAU9UH31_EUPED|nr:unnamed protein product [Euphydryas editha]